jgi:hypothetical protein
LGYNFANVIVVMDTADGTSNNPSVCKLAHCDTTVVTSFTDITALVGDGTGGWTIPTANVASSTPASNSYMMACNMRGRGRYLRLSVSPTTTEHIAAICILSKADGLRPNTAALQGVDAVAVAE